MTTITDTVVNTVTQHATTASAVAEHAQAHHEGGVHVAMAAEQIATFLGLPITNTLLTSWIVMAVLILTAFFVGRSLKTVPGRIQLIFEEAVDFGVNFVKETLENENLAKKVFPLVMTIFMYIFMSNVLEFTPGIGSVGFFKEGGLFAPLLRSVNTDLNVTLALAIISFVSIEVIGVSTIGALKYAGKFINFKSPLAFVVGLIELMSELVRLVSFSFRLFGNIFAGEVLLGVLAVFVPYIIPVPMMMFELFVGFVQAGIFALLTLLFIKLAIIEPH